MSCFQYVFFHLPVWINIALAQDISSISAFESAYRIYIEEVVENPTFVEAAKFAATDPAFATVSDFLPAILVPASLTGPPAYYTNLPRSLQPFFNSVYGREMMLAQSFGVSVSAGAGTVIVSSFPSSLIPAVSDPFTLSITGPSTSIVSETPSSTIGDPSVSVTDGPPIPFTTTSPGLKSFSKGPDTASIQDPTTSPSYIAKPIPSSSNWIFGASEDPGSIGYGSTTASTTMASVMVPPLKPSLSITSPGAQTSTGPSVSGNNMPQGTSLGDLPASSLIGIGVGVALGGVMIILFGFITIKLLRRTKQLRAQLEAEKGREPGVAVTASNLESITWKTEPGVAITSPKERQITNPRLSRFKARYSFYKPQHNNSNIQQAEKLSKY